MRQFFQVKCIGPDQMHGFEHRLLGDLQTASFDLTRGLS